MVKRRAPPAPREADLDRLFAALSDPTRRAIVVRLSRGEATVTELAAPFAMSLPAVSKHLDVLERAGLLERSRDGRTRRCALRPRAMEDAAMWLRKHVAFWEQRLDALERHLANDEPEE